jgi:hypothetical protein
MEAANHFPPTGWVTRYEAARMFHISPDRWRVWERQGRVSCGRIFPVPGTGTRAKLYPLDELRRLREEFVNPPPFPPDGFVDRQGAARILGVAGRTLCTWENEGRVTCGQNASIPGKAGQYKIYPRAELEQLKEQFERELMEAVESFPPAGYVLRDEARAIFGVAVRTWVTWESEGKISCGRMVHNAGRPGCSKIYPREELEKLAAAFERLKDQATAKLQPYPDPERPRCWRLPISSDLHGGMEAIIDQESLPLVQGQRVNWSTGSSGQGAVVLAIGRTFKQLHQLIMGVMGPEYRVAHLNGNRLDCRRDNLVVRTHSEQKASARKATFKGGKACTSRFKGVHFDPEGRKWSATITLAGKTRQLGRFISEIDAALAYDAAAWELYGDHARPNFSDTSQAERLRTQQPRPVAGNVLPPGMVDADEACQMFNIPLLTWTAWEEQGRMPASSQVLSMPSGDACKLYLVEELNRVQENIRDLLKPYPDPERQGVYRVPLKSFVCYREAIIDEALLPLVVSRSWQWQARTDGTGSGQVILSDRSSHAPLSRLVAEVETAGMNTRVSHRNGEALDCRRENLIVRTMQEQLFGNRKMGTVNGRKYTSRFKGVCWAKREEKWFANIQKDGKMRRLGSFHDELEAAQAYDEAAREFFGGYARLNFPDGLDAWLERESDREDRAAA